MMMKHESTTAILLVCLFSPKIDLGSRRSVRKMGEARIHGYEGTILLTRVPFSLLFFSLFSSCSSYMLSCLYAWTL